VEAITRLLIPFFPNSSLPKISKKVYITTRISQMVALISAAVSVLAAAGLTVLIKLILKKEAVAKH